MLKVAIVKRVKLDTKFAVKKRLRFQQTGRADSKISRAGRALRFSEGSIFLSRSGYEPLPHEKHRIIPNIFFMGRLWLASASGPNRDFAEHQSGGSLCEGGLQPDCHKLD
jgi:hypothetical protein